VPFTVVTPLLMIFISAPGVVFLREMAVWQSSSGGFTTSGSVSGRAAMTGRLWTRALEGCPLADSCAQRSSDSESTAARGRSNHWYVAYGRAVVSGGPPAISRVQPGMRPFISSAVVQVLIAPENTGEGSGFGSGRTGTGGEASLAAPAVTPVTGGAVDGKVCFAVTASF
jgi:hypothetical protein